MGLGSGITIPSLVNCNSCPGYAPLPWKDVPLSCLLHRSATLLQGYSCEHEGAIIYLVQMPAKQHRYGTLQVVSASFRFQFASKSFSRTDSNLSTHVGVSVLPRGNCLVITLGAQCKQSHMIVVAASLSKTVPVSC